MCPEKNEIELYGRCTDVVSRSAERCVYRLGSADGEALLTVSSGLSRNRDEAITTFTPRCAWQTAHSEAAFIEICHCREGGSSISPATSFSLPGRPVRLRARRRPRG